MGRLVVLLVLVWMLLPTAVRADTVYLRDGQSIWGKHVYEEADQVVIVRPGGNVRFPKAQVERIERIRTTLPPHYSPPGSTAETPAPAGAAPAAPAMAPAGSPPATAPVAAPAPAITPSPGAGAPAPPGPTPARPTALPPPPPPPRQ